MPQSGFARITACTICAARSDAPLAGNDRAVIVLPMRTLILTLAAASPALAADLPLALPIDCMLGETCFIQNYVDADPGPAGADFTCGPLSYDGHKGTDFALTSFAAMRAGVRVLAAAPGVVLAVRDGMPDTGRDGTDPALLAGKDCGNGVVIDHGDGWQTQYCHMKQGSIAVARGDTVQAGTGLGAVGYSGRTQFAHLHLSVRRDDAVVDPFNTDGVGTCGADDGPDDDLWAQPIAYRPGRLIALGMDVQVPAYAAIKSGQASHAALPGDAPALVGWAYLFGGRAGDVVELTLTDPTGAVFYRHEATLDKTQAQLFRAAGKKAPDGGWMPGDWTVSARLLRGGAVLDARATRVRVGP
jgi:Peptidase family M23